MSKQSWRGSTLLNPEPPVLVSCGGLDHPNLITIGWTGTICTQPSMVSISVRPERFSHHLIQESGQFAINLPTEALVRSVDWCGVKSGRDVDKFAACGLHAEPGSVLTDCPVLAESPVNLECKVTQRIPLGSHDLFLAEVVACDVDESLLDETGKLCLDKAKLIVYSHGEYLALGKKLGTFGYTVRKKKPASEREYAFFILLLSSNSTLSSVSEAFSWIMAARARLASSRRAARSAGAAAASFASYWFTSAWAALSTASS